MCSAQFRSRATPLAVVLDEATLAEIADALGIERNLILSHR